MTGCEGVVIVALGCDTCGDVDTCESEGVGAVAPECGACSDVEVELDGWAVVGGYGARDGVGHCL